MQPYFLDFDSSEIPITPRRLFATPDPTAIVTFPFLFPSPTQSEAGAGAPQGGGQRGGAAGPARPCVRLCSAGPAARSGRRGPGSRGRAARGEGAGSAVAFRGLLSAPAGGRSPGSPFTGPGAGPGAGAPGRPEAKARV